ncbi:hypothetical protein D3C72_1895450 [compost metagenome]
MAQGAGCKVQHRRRDAANVDHLDARLDKALDQRAAEFIAREPAIAAHGHHHLACGQGLLAKGAAEFQRNAFVQRAGHNAANVIGFEDRWRNRHSTKPFGWPGAHKNGFARKPRCREQAIVGTVQAASGQKAHGPCLPTKGVEGEMSCNRPVV